MALLGSGWVTWIANELFDGVSGSIHYNFLRVTKILVFEPIFGFVILLYIASGYGT